MSNKIILRIILDSLIAFSVLNGWWFIALPLALVGARSFSFFVEIIIAGMAYDALFGMMPSLGMRGYAGTISGIILFGVFAILRKEMR